MNAERQRLEEHHGGRCDWKRWGPYLSERQWGTVREDYSPDGTAWDYFPHDVARSRAYRWGEDGIAGISDDQQRLCLSVAMWNGADPILKERLFGLNNREGNHGEDVKECYYYLDATPTHSYLKMLYKYPQAEFPYDELVDENARRDKTAMEFELIDTGVFDEDRYFDVFVEYAKAGADDLLQQITVHNRGPEAATLHLLPQAVFRNTWSWFHDAAKPTMNVVNRSTVAMSHCDMGDFHLHCDGTPELLFCDNETNAKRQFGIECEGHYYKDGFHDFLVHEVRDAVHPKQTGTKVAARYRLEVPARGKAVVRLRLSPQRQTRPFKRFEEILQQRRSEANEFYDELQSEIPDRDARNVQRQAFAGMIWSKQVFLYDVQEWLDGDPAQPPPPPGRELGRNHQWRHVVCSDVLSMPDTWEYPWFAAWDLGFHCLPLALIDTEFAKSQLRVLTNHRYVHPDGQLPAYEWAFSDVNPPVHAWAAWRVFQIDRKQNGGDGDLEFLKQMFNKLSINFTWWVNKKDDGGRDLFQGGFLGLDNIGVFDRSAPLPTGGNITQADGTAWMAMYSLNLMRIAMELAVHEPIYEEMATKFFEHFLMIAEAMVEVAGKELWNEEEGFFFDVLDLPDGQQIPLKIQSIVGLIPLFAVETLEPDMLEKLPRFKARMEWFLGHRPELARLVSRWDEPGVGNRCLLSLLRGHRMKCLIEKMVDESRFFSDFGVRAISQELREKPFTFSCHDQDYAVQYEPGESQSEVFGGNSNWRGPVWFPINYLIVESLQKFHHYYGDDFKIECPTGSGNHLTIKEIANELTRRLTSLFLRDEHGRRPVFGEYEKMQSDPHFRDHIWFHEYFHGDSGRGVGASHQTGWTGVIAKLIQPRTTGESTERRQ